MSSSSNNEQNSLGKRKYDPEHIKHRFICNETMVCAAHNELLAAKRIKPMKFNFGNMLGRHMMSNVKSGSSCAIIYTAEQQVLMDVDMWYLVSGQVGCD